MGLFEDYGSALPEDRREAFKAAVSALDGAVKIDSREAVDKIADNPHLKSYVDAAISRAVASHDEKFKAEKLPGLIAEEMKKNAPKPKDPELAAALDRVEKLEKARQEAEANANRAYQLSKVLPKLTEMGFEADLADMFIGADDATTEARIGAFSKAFEKARSEYVERVLNERFGNMPQPRNGGSNPTTKEALRAEYERLMKEGKRDQANAVYVRMGLLKE